MRLTLIAVVAAASILGAPIAAHGQAQNDASAPGQARATSFVAMPSGVPLAVRPLDNSDANLRLKAKIAAGLGTRHYQVNDGEAPLVLNFETEVQQLGRRGQGPTLGEVTSRTGQGSTSGDATSPRAHDSQVRMNLWSTTQDSLLLGRQSDGSIRASLRYVLTVTLDEPRGGRRLWQGEATYDGAPADDLATFGAMVPILLDQLGRTVRQYEFRLE
ncbi:MAG: hypothetical protein HY246_15195 [Proteobacteria bacterium]|nr:hypothetical protein [Pseudomonadota bacterium]